MYTTLFYIGLILSILGFVFPLLQPKIMRPAARKVSYIFAILSCASFLAFSALAFWEGGKTVISLYSNAGLLDFSFYIDRLSAFFIAVISIVSLSSAVYSMGYGEQG